MTRLHGLVVLGALLTPPAGARQIEPDPRVHMDQRAPAFALTDLDHRRRRSQDVWGERGSILLFVGGRGRPAPEIVLETLRDVLRRARSVDVAVIVVDRRRPAAERDAYQAFGDEGIVLVDPKKEVARIYDAPDHELAYWVDEKRYVRAVVPLSDEQADAELERWLNELALHVEREPLLLPLPPGSGLHPHLQASARERGRRR